MMILSLVMQNSQNGFARLNLLSGPFLIHITIKMKMNDNPVENLGILDFYEINNSDRNDKILFLFNVVKN